MRRKQEAPANGGTFTRAADTRGSWKPIVPGTSIPKNAYWCKENEGGILWQRSVTISSR